MRFGSNCYGPFRPNKSQTLEIKTLRLGNIQGVLVSANRIVDKSQREFVQLFNNSKMTTVPFCTIFMNINQRNPRIESTREKKKSN